MTRIALGLLLASQLMSQTITVLSDKPYGISIPKGSIVILASGALYLEGSFFEKRLIEHAGQVYRCANQSCVDDTISKYKRLYRTNGLSVSMW